MNYFENFGSGSNLKTISGFGWILIKKKIRFRPDPKLLIRYITQNDSIWDFFYLSLKTFFKPTETTLFVLLIIKVFNRKMERFLIIQRSCLEILT